MFKFSRLSIFYALSIFILSACAAPQPANTSAGDEQITTDQPASTQAPELTAEGELVIYSGRSEPLIQPVLDAFQMVYPNVEILLKAGGNSELANALVEEAANPQADVFITTELFTIQALAQQDIFQSYLPQGAEDLPEGFIDPDHNWVGLTRRARVIMYNRELVTPEELPSSIFDLVDPKWKGQIAAAGSTNGSMQAQIAVMRQLLGDEATEEWLQGLLANDVTFFGGHTDVRKAVGAGEFKLGLVNHYYYYLQQAEGSPVGIIFPDQGDGQIGLITNATSAAIIRGASNPAAAQAFLDFLVSSEGQELFAKLNYEYPLREGVPLHSDVQPMDDSLRLASIDVAKAALEVEATFDLMERVGLP
jgi:iron(III) transport system substrate-binding protein